MGLVVRRQMALWWDWRPWVALLGIVVPLGLLLSHAARAWADTHSVYVFLYLDNWTWLFLEIPGARRDLFLLAGRAALGALALAGVSWASGFVLGALSRRTAWVTLLLFAFAVLLGTAGTTTMTRANSFLNGLNGGVLAMPFYAVVFPRLARAILVIVPAWLGLRRSLQGRPLALLPLMAGAVTIAWLTIWPAERLTTLHPPGPHYYDDRTRRRLAHRDRVDPSCSLVGHLRGLGAPGEYRHDRGSTAVAQAT